MYARELEVLSMLRVVVDDGDHSRSQVDWPNGRGASDKVAIEWLDELDSRVALAVRAWRSESDGQRVTARPRECGGWAREYLLPSTEEARGRG